MGLPGEVMEFNLNLVEDKWTREPGFLVMYTIPVYLIAGAIDLIINSLELCSGIDPITEKPRIAERRVGRRQDFDSAVGERTLDVSVERAQDRRHAVRLSR
jgi:hypothetical protein